MDEIDMVFAPLAYNVGEEEGARFPKKFGWKVEVKGPCGHPIIKWSVKVVKASMKGPTKALLWNMLLLLPTG